MLKTQVLNTVIIHCLEAAFCIHFLLGAEFRDVDEIEVSEFECLASVSVYSFVDFMASFFSSISHM